MHSQPPVFSFTGMSVLLIAGILSCGQAGTNKPAAVLENESKPATEKLLVLDQLVGTWQSKNGKNFERWTKNTDGTFRSVAFSVKAADTSWNEQASIYPEKGNWIFENTVRGQNDGKAVKFTSTLLTDKSIQFSNPAHDFPTDINYTLPDINTVHAFIIGPNANGGKDTIPFNYIRVKQ